VGGRRKGFDVALIDGRRILALEGRLTREQVVELVETHCPAVVAIDSPRCCAPDGQKTRKCEHLVNDAICRIRWTPDEDRVRGNPYYAWIEQGLALYDALGVFGADVIEVFPTASWTRWFGPRGHQSRAAWSRRGLASLSLENIPMRSNQDQRDAIAAAVTAYQHSLGMTEFMGEIVLPKDIS
jgi:predicted nuclease with RNAse H fold